MGFGEELWCSQAHASLMRLQDSELRLMELVKKWMTQRAKSDREFSTQLHQMAVMVEKLEGAQPGGGLDYISQLNKVLWSKGPHEMGKDTETQKQTG